MAEFELVMPFLTDDPMFAYGVEIGMLYTRMRDTKEDVVEGYFCRWNQDHITLMASRLGWKVTEMKPWDKDNLWVRLEK